LPSLASIDPPMPGMRTIRSGIGSSGIALLFT
jgi:hypothetical protein